MILLYNYELLHFTEYENDLSCLKKKEDKRVAMGAIADKVAFWL